MTILCKNAMNSVFNDDFNLKTPVTKATEA